MAPYRIMSFDGGGIRGLSYLPVIEQIESHVGTNLVESGQVDMLVGTSTGAIIATGLAIGMTAKDIEQLYVVEGDRIFRRNAPWHQVVSRYSSQRLFEVLDERLAPIGKLTWRQLAELLKDKVELVVVLWRWSINKTVYLSTNLNRPGQLESLQRATVADIVTACCSAPYYFPPRSFTQASEVPKRSWWRRPYFRDEGLVFCDGGITGLNNPTAVGVFFAQSSLEERPDLHVLSFGAGMSDDRGEFGSNIRRWWLLPTLRNVINATFTSTAELMMNFQLMYGASANVKTFLRTDQYFKRGSELDDIAGISDYAKQFKSKEIHYLLYSRNHPDSKLPTDDLRTLPKLTESELETILINDFGIPKTNVGANIATIKHGNLPGLEPCNTSVEATSKLPGRLLIVAAVFSMMVLIYASICLVRDLF